MGVDGARVLLTGATSGIGLATARRLGAAGAHLALWGRRRDRLEDEVAWIAGQGGTAQAIECDLADEAAVRAAVAESVRALGGLDACVLAAGTARFAPLSETSSEDFEHQLTANLRGPFYLLRDAVPHLAAGGTVVLVLSVAADKGFPGCTAYGATKAGLKGLGLALREELRPRRVRVALVTPGATDTPLWDRIDTGDDLDRSQMLLAEDIAHAVAAVLGQSERSAIESIILRPVGGDL